MSLRDLVEPECGGSNALMRLGNQITRDATFKEEGIGIGRSSNFSNRQQFDENQLVNEFLGQISAPPQTFRMDSLLQEMRQIDAQSNPQVIRAAPIMDHVQNDWANEFSTNQMPPPPNYQEMWEQATPLEHHIPQQDRVVWNQQFFEANDPTNQMDVQKAAGEFMNGAPEEQINYSNFMKFMRSVSDGNVNIQDGQVTKNFWAEEFSVKDEIPQTNLLNSEDWAKTFAESKPSEMEQTENYNTQFWNRLQEEWKKISENDETGEHPWLSEFSDYYEPYKEYTFDEENPMIDIENALEKGKAFVAQGDIPSAVLCFETAAKQDPENAEIWELLGTSQAENEKDPNAIPALKKSLSLNPSNMNVLMALAVSYTNESYQNQALKCLIRWLEINPMYGHLIPGSMKQETIQGAEGAMASSLIRGPELQEVQNIFLTAVQSNPTAMDSDIQVALGVLFNLSSEYDKAADCFNAALQVKPDCPKTWNRLGASLANGNRSVEAVEAYKKALDIQPGYIRARYNVGIICINLKSYNEAAEHFLTALNHQSTSAQRSGLNETLSPNKMSETVWGTLRMAISLAGRHDLQAAVDNRDLDTLNKAFEGRV